MGAGGRGGEENRRDGEVSKRPGEMLTEQEV